MTSRRTLCVRIVATDATTVYLAPGYPVDLTMSNGNVYVGGIFSTSSEINERSDGAPAVIDIGSVYDINVMEREELLGGKWDEADVYVFRTDFDNPVEDDEPLKHFNLGKIREEDDRFVVELMSLADKLNQKIGRVYTPGCLWTFCDEHIDGNVIATDRSKCGLTAASFTVTGTVTSVTSKYVFADSSRVEADDYFGNGEIRFTTGQNAGLTFRRISAFLSDSNGGEFTLQMPFYYSPQVGDQYTAIAGCRKRFTTDCVTKYSNGKRFGGFPHVPTTTQTTKYGSQQ